MAVNKLQLDTLYLTYSWSSGNKGICGHTFEIIEYFYILKDKFKVKILICDDLTKEMLLESIKSKYNFTEEEINHILSNTIFLNRPKILIGGYLLIVDGNLMKDKNVVLKFKHIFMFSCGIKDLHLLKDTNISVLHDYRIYDSSIITIDYKKKILFSKLKDVSKCEDNMLLYITKNCRKLSFNELKSISLKFKNKNILAIVNFNEEYKYQFENVTFLSAPVKNILEKFNTYCYTSISRKFDCSPRFIAECKFYNKEVIYEIDYLEEDKGLYWRKFDIENDFENLYLNENDEIINIIKLKKV